MNKEQKTIIKKKLEDGLKSMKPFNIWEHEGHKVNCYSESQIMILFDIIDYLP